MTPIAVLFFALAALVIWGGLVASVIYLVRHNASAAAAPEQSVSSERDLETDEAPKP